MAIGDTFVERREPGETSECQQASTKKILTDWKSSRLSGRRSRAFLNSNLNDTSVSARSALVKWMTTSICHSRGFGAVTLGLVVTRVVNPELTDAALGQRL